VVPFSTSYPTGSFVYYYYLSHRMYFFRYTCIFTTNLKKLHLEIKNLNTIVLTFVHMGCSLFVYLARNHNDYPVRRRSKKGRDMKKNLRHLVLFHTKTRTSQMPSNVQRF
jgi:hypothetical protein